MSDETEWNVVELHDAVLLSMTVHWQARSLELRFRAATGPAMIVAYGLTLLHAPRIEPWGPSDSVLEIVRSIELDGDGVHLVLKMQSGDDIVVEAAEITDPRHTQLPLRAILGVAAGVDPEITRKLQKASEQVSVQLHRMLGCMRCDVAEPVRLVTTLHDPSVDLERGDGSCLTVGYAGELAFLRWIDSLGASYHSGAADDPHELLVFDYFGSWTEIPKGCCIPAADATAAAVNYFCSGRPEHDRVLLEPD